MSWERIVKAEIMVLFYLIVVAFLLGDAWLLAHLLKELGL